MNSNLLSDWLGYINSNRPDEGEFGLERLQKIFTKIVKKPLAQKSIIIGGTNGKGTTVEYLKNLFLNTNYKVGVYTSPHLINFNERIQINGKNIDDENKGGFFTLMRSHRARALICAAIQVWAAHNLCARNGYAIGRFVAVGSHWSGGDGDDDDVNSVRKKKVEL